MEESTTLGSVRSWIGDIADMFAFPLRVSHYAELINPLWSTHALQARVEEVWDETAEARTLTLRPGRTWRRHRAGQHVRLGLPIGGMHYRRTYSISSAPERDDRCITITVKAIAGGRMSHHLVREVKPGHYLPLGLPQGEFYLPDAQPVRPLFVTGGSGITPVMSIMRSLIAQRRLPETVHLHYAPHAYDVIFGKELREMAAEHARYRLHLAYTREPGETESRKRHFTPVQLDEVCPDWRERETYACGPQGLIDALEAHWAAAGLERRLHVERFHAPMAALPEGVGGGRVRFAKANVTVDGDGRAPLLRVAEDAGLNPQHGCRMGICHTCPVTLRAGSVRDLRTGLVHGEPGDKVLICINAAAGDCELEI